MDWLTWNVCDPRISSDICAFDLYDQSGNKKGPSVVPQRTSRAVLQVLKTSLHIKHLQRQMLKKSGRAFDQMDSTPTHSRFKVQQTVKIKFWARPSVMSKRSRSAEGKSQILQFWTHTQKKKGTVSEVTGILSALGSKLIHSTHSIQTISNLTHPLRLSYQ